MDIDRKIRKVLFGTAQTFAQKNYDQDHFITPESADLIDSISVADGLYSFIPGELLKKIASTSNRLEPLSRENSALYSAFLQAILAACESLGAAQEKDGVITLTPHHL